MFDIKGASDWPLAKHSELWMHTPNDWGIFWRAIQNKTANQILEFIAANSAPSTNLITRDLLLL
jgi:hypothetical protein